MREGLFKRKRFHIIPRYIFSTLAFRMTRRSWFPAQISIIITIRDSFSRGEAGARDRGKVILPELEVEAICAMFGSQKQSSSPPKKNLQSLAATDKFWQKLKFQSLSPRNAERKAEEGESPSSAFLGRPSLLFMTLSRERSQWRGQVCVCGSWRTVSTGNFDSILATEKPRGRKGNGSAAFCPQVWCLLFLK